MEEYVRAILAFLLSADSCIRNLQNTLAQVIAFEHAEKAIDGVVDAVGDVIDGLETAVKDPARHVVVSLLGPLSDVGVENQEALPLDPPAHDLRVVLYSVGRVGRGRVVR